VSRSLVHPIDDYPSIRSVLREPLTLEGDQIPEGAAGVRLYREHRPALVLLDMIMLLKGGLENR